METIACALRDSLPGPQGPPRDIRFVGADIRGARLAEAEDRGRRLASARFTAEFINADCSKLAQHRQLGSGFGHGLPAPPELLG
jgi:hypothetical protein